MPTAVPIGTYRLQLTARFGFAQAAAIVSYLKTLGISHLYVSPFLKARHGSTHGYDVVDHNALNPELGGEEGFQPTGPLSFLRPEVYKIHWFVT